MVEPSYLKLYESGELRERARRLTDRYSNCTICPRNCKVDRNQKKGVCSGGTQAKINSVFPHFGEERPLVGRNGSGTIFLSYCNLLCLYCQNWELSHDGEGHEVSDEQLASEMIRLQHMGCHNINFVTPTHYVPNIVSALVIAVEKGLKIPIVYNTSSYDNPDVLELLDGVVDIYLPDYKYWDSGLAAKYSKGARNYPEMARKALKEMHRQVGKLKTDEEGIAVKGLMIRHLVMPNRLAGTDAFTKFVAEELDPGTYVNIMAQYYPAYKACNVQALSRRTSNAEYRHALICARENGLYNLD